MRQYFHVVLRQTTILRYTKTRRSALRHVHTSATEQARFSFNSKRIWVPAFAVSCVVLGTAAAAVASPNRREELVQLFKDAQESLERTAKAAEKDAKESQEPSPIDKLLKLLDVAKEEKPPENFSVKLPSLGWNGLSFLQNSLPSTTLANVMSQWTWPASLARIREQANTLLLTLGTSPGSLYSEIVNSSLDTTLHPECEWDAQVRLGDDLCLAERAFLRERRRRMKPAFAKLFGVKESEIDERDLPIVAIAGSGGGYRAMCNTIGSLLGAQDTGILDCTTYTAGISGSCWALGILYSGIAGEPPTPFKAAEHILNRISTTYLDGSTLDMLISPPTNKYLLSGLIQKATGPHGSVHLIDLYGTLVSSRLYVPSDLSHLNPQHLSLYQFRRFVDGKDSSLPLPIFTAIKHEISLAKEAPLRKIQQEEATSVDTDRYLRLKQEEYEIERQSRWLWFEFTPYEVGCDELGAWIPSWSLGRQFEFGRSVDRRPELSFTILAGIYASAFCASLKDYFVEIQPLLRQLPDQLYGWLEEIISENQEEWGTIHPVVPNKLPNFVKGMSGQLREGSPPDITERETLGFMDAGAELNIPYYPLLRRNVDCIIALDASADSQDLWFTRAEEYAMKKGLSTWPRGARWPVTVQSPDQPTSPKSNLKDDETVEESANRKVAEAQESELAGQASRQRDSEARGIPDVDSPRSDSEPTPSAADSVGHALEACTIWIGSSTDSDEAMSSRVQDLSEEELAQRDGIGIVYMPLIPNDQVPGLNPAQISTWRRELERNETEQLLNLAKLNFLSGEEKVVKLLKAMWIRKKRARKELERKRRKERGLRKTLMDRFKSSN